MFYTYYADTLVTLMLGWIRGFTDWIWRLISLGDGSAGRNFLSWFSGNWLKLVIVLIAIGVAADWIVWLIRWRPYWLWFGKKRRILNDTDEQEAHARHAAPIAAGRSEEKRPEAPHFSSKAMPRSRIAQPAEEYEEDDLFDVISSSLPQTSPSPEQNHQQRLVGASVNQYISASQRSQAKQATESRKSEEIEWFD